MTRWGIVMLIAFLVIGLRPRIDERNAVRAIIWISAIVLLLTFAKAHAL